MSSPNERDALLPVKTNRALSSLPAQGSDSLTTAVESSKEVEKRPGPLEISRSNRHAILAGIWVATFLSVSDAALHARHLYSSMSCECSRLTVRL